MEKKSLDRKTVKKAVIASREAGKTDREIYDELGAVYFDKKSIAKIILGTVTPERKQQYKIYNILLLILIGITILFKILIVAALAIAFGKPAVLLLALVVPIINIVFFVQVARYDAGIYKICGILTALSLAQSLTKLTNMTDVLVTLVLAGGIIGLSFFLSAKLFPDYKNDPAKGPDGEYIS